MEYKKKCNVCGQIFCYTDEDLKNNASNAGLAALEALGGLASALGGGTIFHTQYLQGQSDKYSDKVVDYDQCPHCHSRDVSFYSGDTKVSNTATSVLEEPVAKAININSSASTESLLKRAFIFLEDGDWVSANSYCEACLDVNPELAEAYLAKLMVEKKAHTLKELASCKEPLAESRNYQKALRYGNEVLAAQLKELCGNAENNIKRIAEIRDRLSDPDCSVMVDVLDGHLVAIDADGTIQIRNNHYGECEPEKWKDLVSIGIGYENIVGLRNDGTVVACGKNSVVNDSVTKWKDIKTICIAGSFVIGLRTDGTVVACGTNGYFRDEKEKWARIVQNASKWEDVVSIDASTSVVVGLCRDGSVKFGDTNAKVYSYISSLRNVIDVKASSFYVAVFFKNGTVELIQSEKRDVTWENIKDISGPYATKICLKDDGTVFKWKDDENKLSVNDWRDIVAIDSGASYVVGLTQSGTVVACGNNQWGQCDVSDWKDIVAIMTDGGNLTIGIRENGTVVSCGEGPDGIVNCSGLKLFNDVTDLDKNIAKNKGLRIAAEKAAEERRIAAEKAAEERRIAEEKAAEEHRKSRIAELEEEKRSLQSEIPNIKGILASGKKKKLEARILDIDAELKKLNS